MPFKTINKKEVNDTIKKIPVLTLDCNPDFENSKEQQQKHAQSIVNFIGEYYTEYLKDLPRSVTLEC